MLASYALLCPKAAHTHHMKSTVLKVAHNTPAFHPHTTLSKSTQFRPLAECKAITHLLGVRHFLRPLLLLLFLHTDDTNTAPLPDRPALTAANDDNNSSNNATAPSPDRPALLHTHPLVPIPLPDRPTLAAAVRQHAPALFAAWVESNGGVHLPSVRALFEWLAKEGLVIMVRRTFVF